MKLLYRYVVRHPVFIANVVTVLCSWLYHAAIVFAPWPYNQNGYDDGSRVRALLQDVGPLWWGINVNYFSHIKKKNMNDKR